MVHVESLRYAPPTAQVLPIVQVLPVFLQYHPKESNRSIRSQSWHTSSNLLHHQV